MDRYTVICGVSGMPNPAALYIGTLLAQGFTHVRTHLNAGNQFGILNRVVWLAMELVCGRAFVRLGAGRNYAEDIRHIVPVVVAVTKTVSLGGKQPCQ